MAKKAWADVRVRDIVELGGREWTVEKIEHGKKKTAVKVVSGKRSAMSTVKSAEKVKVVGRAEKPKKGKLFDRNGTAQRWATEKEAAKAGVGLKPGDPDVTKPPAKPGPDLWETPHGKVERMLGELMGARLVAESRDEGVGYYVEPVNVSTVAAHLALFHGGIPEACQDDETRMLGAHEAQHAAAVKGEGILAVNHWHTPTRPK